VWKWLIAIVVVLVVLLGGAAWFAKSSGLVEKLEKQLNPQLKPVEVRFDAPARGKLIRTINAPGELEPKTKVEISAQVSARILELPFRENQQVKEGDLIVRLDARDLQALLDSAKAQLRSEEARLEGARASLANAEAELNRRQKLVTSGDIAKTDVETAQLQYDTALSTLRQVQHGIDIAKANITRAEKDLDNTIIKSPMNGVITKLNAEVGETVVVGTLNSPGSVILEIADLDTMRLIARVDEANIARVKDQQSATVYVNAFPDLRIPGVVETIGLKREQDTNGTRYFETKVLIERPRDLLLRSGLTANVDIEVDTYDDVLKIPSQAVLDRAVDDLPADITKDNPNIEQGKKFTRIVFIEKDGKAHAVPISIGASDNTSTIVKAGLDETARVITGPFKALTNLTHGQVIAEQGKTPAATDTKTTMAGGK
jgi:HlyD family secretion protein